MIKIVIFTILLSSCSFNKISMQTFPAISEAYVFSSFDKGGTTASIRKTYSELSKNKKFKHEVSKEHIDELNSILRYKRYKKHTQQKIGGIEKGIEICDSNGCYGLILTQTRLIDISRNYEYDLTQEEYEKFIELFRIQ